MLVTVTFEVDISTDSMAEAESAGWYMRMQSQLAWPNGRQYMPVDVEVEGHGQGTSEAGRVLRKPES